MVTFVSGVMLVEQSTQTPHPDPPLNKALNISPQG